MIFDKNPLPNFVVADLYKNNLFVIDTPQPQKQTIQPTNSATPTNHAITFLGENKKQIIILVNEENAVHINDDHFAFLSNILTACKLNIADVAIVNVHKQTINFNRLKEQLNCMYVLLFNVSTDAIELPFSIPHYQVQKYNNCTFLSANHLQTMLGAGQDAKMEKSKLWLSLKQMFGI